MPFSTQYLKTFNQLTIKDIIIFSFLLLVTIFWMLIVTKDWIRYTAFAYAERLLESLNDI